MTRAWQRLSFERMYTLLFGGRVTPVIVQNMILRRAAINMTVPVSEVPYGGFVSMLVVCQLL